MAEGATGILGTLRILVDADASKARSTLEKLGGVTGVVAKGIGAGFGVMAAQAISGGNALAEAFARFQAETGLTGAAADEARQQMVDLFSVNTESFDVIGATLASVHKNLGLTGEAAKTATQDVLEYARATGQDAVGATEAMDDAMDSWGLSADEMAGLMDRLLVSNQRWGGTITDTQRTLAALAPAMKAANLTLDDGIELLNLFGAKGLDATSASAAFAKALTKVESPEELQAMIDDIVNTEDDFQRAAKAADLFGARAGAKLANALDGVRLDDFGVSADEAAGAVDRASDAIENTPINWLTLQLRKIQGPLADFGAGFGPVLLALSSMGPLLNGVGALVGGLATILVGSWRRAGPLVTAAAGVVGAAAGAAYEGALFVASKILAALSALWALISGASVTAATAAGAASGAAFSTAFAGGVALALPAAIGGAEVLAIAATAGGAAGAAFLGSASGGGFLATVAKLLPLGLQGALAPLALAVTWDTENVPFQATKHPDGSLWLGDKQVLPAPSRDPIDVPLLLEPRMEWLADSMERQRQDAAKGLATTSARLWSFAGEQIDHGAEELNRRLSAKTLFDLAGPIRKSFQLATAEIAKGFGNVKQALANPPQLISRDDRLENMDKRMGKVMEMIHRAVKAKDPVNLDYWEKARANLQGKIERLRGKHVATQKEVARAYRKAGGDAKAAWDRSSGAMVRRADSTKRSIVSTFSTLGAAVAMGVDLTAAGVKAGQTFAAGVQASIETIRRVVAAAANVVKQYLGVNSPTEKGPLSKLDRWGPGFVRTWLDPIENSTPRVRRVGAKLAEAIIPHHGLGRAMVGAGARGGGDTYQIGTLIADDGGIDELDRRISRRRRRRERGAGRDYNRVT